MDDLDKKLYHDMKIDIPIPDKCRTIIKESLYNEEKIKKVYFRSLTRVITIICISLLLNTGIVYAGTKIYEKIWKDPEKLEGFYSEKNSEKYLSESQIKDTTMSKETAINEINSLLRKFNHEDETIEKIELINNSENCQLVWKATTNRNNYISINADNSSSYYVNFDNVITENIKGHSNVTESEVINFAKTLCEKYGYDVSNYTHVRAYSNERDTKTAYIWYVEFFKEYNGVVNPYERIRIGFIPPANKIYIFEVCNENYENNSEEITEEQAKAIVSREEEKINVEYPIKNITSEIAIVSTNDNSYLRVNDYEQYYKQSYSDFPVENLIEYRVDRHIRKAWVITITYSIPENVDKIYYKFSYFVDVTTREIIGGEDDYDNIKKLIYE